MSSSSLGFTNSLGRITHGFDHHTCWVQARGGVIPPNTQANASATPIAVVTMQQLVLTGSDVFSGLYESRSMDRGQSWTPVTEQVPLRRWKESGSVEGVICDGTPQWHAATGKLLLTGHVARYLGDALMPNPRPRHTAYAVYDHIKGQWSEPRFIQMPDQDQYFSAGSGSGQRVDLPDGDVLIPVYHKSKSPDQPYYNATVVRCHFDGQTLSVADIGSHQVIQENRGLCEPSLTQFDGRYFMTLRTDMRGYVTSSDDGLRYDAPREWTFDDGLPLGNYNTQQHWINHSDGLYLVYTRRGLNNDHVFRHRAPLVMARVDPEKLVVIRETEKIVVPERGARLGNFGAFHFDENESWIIAAEWMQNSGTKVQPPSTMPHGSDLCVRYGSDNSVFVVRLNWNKANTNV